MVSHFTAMVSFLSETIWNQMKPYHFYHLLPNENCLCGSSLFLSGYETDERSSLGRSGAPLPAADAGGPLRWRNKEQCEAVERARRLYFWWASKAQSCEKTPELRSFKRLPHNQQVPPKRISRLKTQKPQRFLGFFMPIFKVEFKRYHFPKSTFGEDLN